MRVPRPGLHLRIALSISLAVPLWVQASSDLSPTVVLSTTVQSLSLSVYRDPQVADGESMDPDWPGGYALITETRRLDLPAGEFILRFEGVAEGMFPESAIVSGLPGGVREKNRDARLLSPAGLVDAYLKRSVRITRTNKATGVIRDMDAIITAAPNGAVVLQSSEGYEALHCTGLPERMQFSEVPANLSAKPSLSVIASSTKPVRTTVTLSYLAEGFDWEANYLATVRQLARDGSAKVDLFAWLTLANGGTQSFPDAQTVAIAGTPNRVERSAQIEPFGGPLRLQCWPTQRSHEVPFNQGFIPSPLSPPSESGMEYLEHVTVTGYRMKRAEVESASPVAEMVVAQEELGDLKLYRVPEPVTVRAKGQKQVALLIKPQTKFQWYYASEFAGVSEVPMTMMLRTENSAKNGLGLPLPKGRVEIFEASIFGNLWLQQDLMLDRAVGEKFALKLTQASDVRLSSTKLATQIRGTVQRSNWRLTLSNARANGVNAEVKILLTLAQKDSRITSVDGVPTWRTKIPANGEVSIELWTQDAP